MVVSTDADQADRVAAHTGFVVFSQTDVDTWMTNQMFDPNMMKSRHCDSPHLHD